MLTSEFLSGSISFRTSQPIGHFILTFSLCSQPLWALPPILFFFPQVLFLIVLLKFVPEIEQTLM